MPEGQERPSDGPTPGPDFVAAWREWLSTTERQWNELLGQTMGTEQFAAGLGQNLDVFLHIQRVMNEAMGNYLTTVNVPTRTDVLELGERLGGIESRLAAMEAQFSLALETLGRLSVDSGPPSVPRPARTRRPPDDPASASPTPPPPPPPSS